MGPESSAAAGVLRWLDKLYSMLATRIVVPPSCPVTETHRQSTSRAAYFPERGPESSSGRSVSKGDRSLPGVRPPPSPGCTRGRWHLVRKSCPWREGYRSPLTDTEPRSGQARVSPMRIHPATPAAAHGSGKTKSPYLGRFGHGGASFDE